MVKGPAAPGRPAAPEGRVVLRLVSPRPQAAHQVSADKVILQVGRLCPYSWALRPGAAPHPGPKMDVWEVSQSCLCRKP